MKSTHRRRISPVSIISVIIILIIIAVILFMVKRFLEYSDKQYQMMMHPLTYSDFVEKYAEENGVDKYLIYAVIKTESGFNPEAVSYVGARGLMQIMEETFDWIKYRLKDEASVYNDMYKVEDNIRYGSYLIGYNLRYFENQTCAVAAYHAGVGSVSSWLEDDRYTSDGKTLKEIPISDTNHYVNKIDKAYSMYKELYEEDDN